MTAIAVAPRFASSLANEPLLSSLCLREAVCQTSESSRNLLGLMALTDAAQRDLNSGSPETTLDGVISKAVLRSLLGALHYRDIGTVRHSRRVALLAVGLAHHLGWEGRHLRVLEVAALLHDIGKIGVPDNVLYKPGKLNPDELELMALHYGIGVNVLQACRVDREVIEIVDQSHRAYEYDDREHLSVRAIPMGARILAVADAYESMCTEQVYRRAKPHDDIMKLLMAESGKQFDGNIVSTLARWVQQDGLPFVAQTAELSDVGRHKAHVSAEEAAEAMTLCQIFSYLYMLESLYDGFHIVDAERRFVVWNRGAERLIGSPATSMLGQPWDSSLFGVPKHDNLELGRVDSSLDQAIACGKTVISQLPFARSEGEKFQVELQTVPLIDASGRLHGVAEIFRDLSRGTSRKSQAPEFKKLKLQASRDALTSVANRGELEHQLKRLIEEYRRNSDVPFCVIFADADHFKRVNDTYGHQVGDQVLIDLAKHFCDETYSGEVVGRYGGEEFVILCPATELDQAVRRADRLRSSMKNAKIGGKDRLSLTCSFGVSQAEPDDTSESLLGRADRALYVAKESGRDRTCSYTREQLSQVLSVDPKQRQLGEIPFEFSATFSAVVAADMVIHKLGGFIRDKQAQLGDVEQERVVVQMSGYGWLSYFSKSPDRQGVEIELLLEGARSNYSQKLQIKVKMRPYGWYRNHEAFTQRTWLLMRELKQYFAAE